MAPTTVFLESFDSTRATALDRADDPNLAQAQAEALLNLLLGHTIALNNTYAFDSRSALELVEVVLDTRARVRAENPSAAQRLDDASPFLVSWFPANETVTDFFSACADQLRRFPSVEGRFILSAQKLREERSRSYLFENHPGFPFEILFEREDQDAVADRFAKMYEARGIPAEYADIGVVYQNPYLIVCNDAVRFPTGDRGVYSRILGAREGQGAAGLPVLPDGRIVLVRHARHASREWHWEIPRGFAEAGGDGAETARREVEEELGCEVRDLEFLGLMHSDTGRGAQGDALYLVRVGPVDTTLSEDAVREGIGEIRPVSVETFRTMLANGDITDSFTLAAHGLAVAKGLLPG